MRRPVVGEGTVSAVPAGAPAPLRQEHMATLVDRAGFARVGELAKAFGVSAVTVRADLEALHAAGRLRRVRGGALAGRNAGERPFEESAIELVAAKSAIGRAAAAMVGDNDTVLLDVGTTTTAVARALIERRDLREVTVCTSSLNIALELEVAHPRISVLVTGGTARPLQHSLVNPMATVLLERLNATVAFVGCNGVDTRAGVTNVNLPEAEVKRAIVSASRRRVVVADASKLGAVAVAKVCDLADVDVVVTDASADPEQLSRIAAAGCAVEVADAEPAGRQPLTSIPDNQPRS